MHINVWAISVFLIIGSAHSNSVPPGGVSSEFVRNANQQEIVPTHVPAPTYSPVAAPAAPAYAVSLSEPPQVAPVLSEEEEETREEMAFWDFFESIYATHELDHPDKIPVTSFAESFGTPAVAARLPSALEKQHQEKIPLVAPAVEIPYQPAAATADTPEVQAVIIPELPAEIPAPVALFSQPKRF